MANKPPFVIETEGLEELQDALKKFHDEWQPIATRALGPGLADLVSNVRKEARSDMGVARASFGSETHEYGIYQITRSGSQIVGTIGSRLSYAPYALEYGRGPGKMPPIERLEEWAQRHGMAGAGFVIARAIAARGVSAPRTITNVLQRRTKAVVKKFEEGITKELRRLKLKD